MREKWNFYGSIQCVTLLKPLNMNNAIENGRNAESNKWALRMTSAYTVSMHTEKGKKRPKNKIIIKAMWTTTIVHIKIIHNINLVIRRYRDYLTLFHTLDKLVVSAHVYKRYTFFFNTFASFQCIIITDTKIKSKQQTNERLRSHTQKIASSHKIFPVARFHINPAR